MLENKTITIDADVWDRTQYELFKLSTLCSNQDNKIWNLYFAFSNLNQRQRKTILKHAIQ